MRKERHSIIMIAFVLALIAGSIIADGYARKLREMGFDPPVCHIMHRDHDILIIRDMHPDICFGYISEPVEGLKVAEQMGDFFGITGYERTVGILSRIFNVLETGKMGERLDIYGAVPV